MRKTKITFADAVSAATVLKMALKRMDGFDVLYRQFERKMTIAGRRYGGKLFVKKTA
jgi:hypothetical protein